MKTASESVVHQSRHSRQRNSRGVSPNSTEYQGSPPAFRPKVGSRVQIANLETIMASLDARGCCDGMPFMPEMISYVGRSFDVSRWANTVCVFGETVQFRKLDDCVVLKMPRCCGSAHGHCQMACTFLWKTQWLEPAGQEKPRIVPAPKVLNVLHDNARRGDCYQCQSTRLMVATNTTSGRWSQLNDEWNLNRVSTIQMATDFCSTLMSRAKGQKGGLVGPCTGRTPSQDLGLKQGDLVRVKTESEIRQTLGADGKNRGLWFDPKMLVYCGAAMKVTRRVEQFINESTGQMVRPSVPSIVLDDQKCDGRGRRYCSRLLHYFWREIWLQRV